MRVTGGDLIVLEKLLTPFLKDCFQDIDLREGQSRKPCFVQNLLMRLRINETDLR